MKTVHSFLCCVVCLLGCRDVPSGELDESVDFSSVSTEDPASLQAPAQVGPARDSGGPSTQTGIPVATSGDAQGSSSDELYDDRRVPRFDFELAAADLAALRRDPDTYVRATLHYGSEVIRNVGLRIKGEGSLRTIDRKAAFKIKFDEFVPEQTFRGLKHLTLNNMVEDPSFLAERMAYYVYRAAKLPAPRCNSALVSVNGALFGLYANVETEDKTFLRRWFKSDEGNLYEEGQVDFERGAETKFDLETNESKNDRSDLRALIDAVSATPTPAALLERWDAVLDTAHFLRFTATEAAVNQWDMYAYTVFYPNNFRIYHDPDARKFVFLPWGMDLSMKPYRDSGKKHVAVFGIARKYDRANGKISAGKMFQQCMLNAACKARYAGVVRDVVAIYEGANLESLAAQYFAQVAPLVRDDPRKEYTVEQFENGYRALLATIRARPGAMRTDLTAAGFSAR